MSDLLGHVFVAVAVGRLLASRYEWFGRPYVTATMIGAVIPDLVKVDLLVPAWRVEDLVGVPFSWMPFETAFGAGLCVLVGVIAVAPRVRRVAGLALSAGVVTHLVLDGVLWTPSGRLYHPMFWPLTQWHTPSPGWFHSTDPTPTLLAGVVATVVVVLTNPYDGESSGEGEHY